MADKLAASVVTPIKKLVAAAVDQVVAPAVCGQITVLPSHAPLLAELQAGVLELRAGGRADKFFIAGGFIEVERDRVVVLAETGEAVSDIDVERARRALADAEGKLKTLDASAETYAYEQARAARARGRLEAAK